MARTTTALVCLAAAFGVASAQVATLTASNFETEVVNGGKNAFVKFYAPWCGHCKALAPAWNELGDAYPDTGSVVIGDVDCTVEESLCSEYEVRGYPTLKYFTAETGKEGAPYEGGRALDDLKSFVEETLEIKCAVDDVARCSEKERSYIEKMKAKSPEEVDAALKRLDGMIGGSMKPELKQWIVQRARILRQMQSA